ncbi:AAA family ATPase [Saccharomonospora piscinae]|uniref:AAA family ATPase n=1 Tax=Saccharomonospora piscinae TaxID=687388 RepID=UPI00046620D3|nr:AAA family ATPase [Saccharomonospora piscinae]
MIVWVNGPFGAGKTTVVETLAELHPESMVFDPEEVGFMLRALVPPAPTHDFQDLPIWRTLTAATAVEIVAEYGRPLLVPMTLVRRDYLDEIFGGLRAAGLPVRHFFLTLDDAVLRRRIRDQVFFPDDPQREADVREWRLAQVSRCLAARADMPENTTFLDSGTTEPHELARQIAKHLPSS